MGAWNGGSWLGCRDLPAMGAVFYLGAGWPQWKPLGIPGTHLPLKRGSWLIILILVYYTVKSVIIYNLHMNTSLVLRSVRTYSMWSWLQQQWLSWLLLQFTAIISILLLLPLLITDLPINGAHHAGNAQLKFVYVRWYPFSGHTSELPWVICSSFIIRITKQCVYIQMLYKLPTQGTMSVTCVIS